jgi:hypothetical protein
MQFVYQQKSILKRIPRSGQARISEQGSVIFESIRSKILTAGRQGKGQPGLFGDPLTVRSLSQSSRSAKHIHYYGLKFIVPHFSDWLLTGSSPSRSPPNNPMALFPLHLTTFGIIEEKTLFQSPLKRP